MIRSLSTVQLAARHDPKPWLDDYGIRWRNDLSPSTPTIFRPRPEFIPAADPLPYLCSCGKREGWLVRHLGDAHALKFKPRSWPELYAAGVRRVEGDANPILAAFRESSGWPSPSAKLDAILYALKRPGKLVWGRQWTTATPEQINDARKVLTKLRNVIEATK